MCDGHGNAIRERSVEGHEEYNTVSDHRSALGDVLVRGVKIQCMRPFGNWRRVGMKRLRS